MNVRFRRRHCGKCGRECRSRRVQGSPLPLEHIPAGGTNLLSSVYQRGFVAEKLIVSGSPWTQVYIRIAVRMN